MAEWDHENPICALAISAFKSDRQILELLERVFRETSRRFYPVIVVDSLGSGRISHEIAKNAWPVIYFNADRNLGSAGNLARRLEIAADSDSEWCYCLNHDGYIDVASIEKMVVAAGTRPRVGAVYPLLHHDGNPKPWEDGRKSFFPSTQNRSDDRPGGTADPEVLWGSSNGALYNLTPYREGLRVWAELWLGYEDLGYGAVLNDNGWTQLICRDAVLGNLSDYRPVTLLGRSFYIPDKPFWYSYYGIRNLLLIQRRRSFSVRFALFIVVKIFRETATILLLHREKFRRLSLMWLGVVHGLIGRFGKGKYPIA